MVELVIAAEMAQRNAASQHTMLVGTNLYPSECRTNLAHLVEMRVLAKILVWGTILSVRAERIPL